MYSTYDHKVLNFFTWLASSNHHSSPLVLTIENCEMHDIPMVGRKYTWFRPNGKAMSGLDRALVTEDWLKHWLGTK